MQVIIYQDKKGKPVVSVEGSTKNTPEQVVRAYKKAIAELNKKEDK